MPVPESKENAMSLHFDEREVLELGLVPGKSYELSRVKPGIWVLTEKEEGIQIHAPPVHVPPAAIQASSPASPAAHVVPPKASSLPATAVPSPPPSLLETHIFQLLKAKKWAELMEGRFETFLTAQEKTVFAELVKSGRIVKFKSSPKYKKSLYKTVENEKSETEPSPPRSEAKSAEKKSASPAPLPHAVPVQKAPSPLPATSAAPPLATGSPAPPSVSVGHPAPSISSEGGNIERDGYAVLENSGDASAFSRQYGMAFKGGEILGLRGFDGKYYVAQVSYLHNWRDRILKTLAQESPLSLADLASRCKGKEGLVRTVCEFLREEGEIIEKRKGLYALVRG